MVNQMQTHNQPHRKTSSLMKKIKDHSLVSNARSEQIILSQNYLLIRCHMVFPVPCLLSH